MNLELPGPATRSGWLLRRGAWASASTYNYRHDRGAMTVLSEVESLCLRTYKRVFMGGGLKSSSLYGSTSSGLCVWCQFRPTSWVMTRSAEGGCETSGGICPLTDPLDVISSVADLSDPLLILSSCRPFADKG